MGARLALGGAKASSGAIGNRNRSGILQSSLRGNGIEAFLNIWNATDDFYAVLSLDFLFDDGWRWKYAKSIAAKDLEQGAIFKLCGDVHMNAVAIKVCIECASQNASLHGKQ